jgi:hypothetical protein
MEYLESYGHHAQPGARPSTDGEFNNAVPDPDFAPNATHEEPEPQATRSLP